MLKELTEKYQHHTFRISPKGFLQRKMGLKWFTVCIHNRQLCVCPHDECGGGSQICKHKIRKSDCKDKECGGAGALCEHLIRRGQCKTCGKLRCKHGRLWYRCPEDECNGTSLCIHKKIRNICPEESCGGGTSLCVHKVPRSKCRNRDCGAGTYCKHDKERSKCNDPECEGGGSYCKHAILRTFCSDPECGGGKSLCVICKTRFKLKEGYCAFCHPDYVPSKKGASKISCQFICALEKHLGSGIQIQHKHYDLSTKSVIGDEYTLPEYKKKRPDGYYINTNGQKIVIEFLGDFYHGHPSFWGVDEEERDFFGRLHKDNFERTERIFTKVASFGYIIRYVWESDYKNLKALSSVESILREFKGKLEY